MNKTLAEIAQQLKNSDKKVQLIYAFNGTGKTRLSRDFRQLIAPRNAVGEFENAGADEAADDAGDADADIAEVGLSRDKILYYNAFTEDLFYWDNDLTLDADPKLKIQPNSFTNWILQDQGQDQNIIANFQRYVNGKLTPRFNAEYKTKDSDDNEVTVEAFSEVTFTFETGDDVYSSNFKISKGEESCFVWSLFYTLLELVIEVLNVAEPADRETNDFNKLEYVFVDDPVSSLDDNHLIELAVDLATLIKSNASDIKFIISTHNPLFFNVLVNELGSDDKTHNPTWRSKWFAKSRLEKFEDGSYQLIEQPNDSPFSYHLHLISQLEGVIKTGQIEKYHFNLLRNILEKTATFLGYKRWEQLLPETSDGGPNPYAKRIVNFSSHSKHAAEEVPPLKPEEKKVLENLVKHVVANHRFWQEKIT
ncbi:AAA family ATPase [Planctomicrobium sp. SH668]|uniref:AAA family ATPase n=1 Tax=Planctomicrobium sp. SH668 TaxID=3448126 RepID=UPI003F5BAA38